MPDGPPERVAVVTGAGRGIGAATASKLADSGHRVLAVSRTESDLARFLPHGNIEILVESVATESGCDRISSEVLSRFGSVDILVSNAGIGSFEERPIWNQEVAAWEDSIAVNLTASFHLIRRMSRDMIERGWGRIVVVSSTAAHVGEKANSAYSAAKAGVIGLVRAAAQDLIEFGVTCNAVLPGWVRTEMADADAAAEARERGITPDEVWKEREASYAAGRVLSPDEIADVICFLASDESSGVNGEEVTVSLGSFW